MKLQFLYFTSIKRIIKGAKYFFEKIYKGNFLLLHVKQFCY